MTSLFESQKNITAYYNSEVSNYAIIITQLSFPLQPQVMFNYFEEHSSERVRPRFTRNFSTAGLTLFTSRYLAAGNTKKKGRQELMIYGVALRNWNGENTEVSRSHSSQVCEERDSGR